MEIRAARFEDARRIAEIHVAAWKAAYRGIMAEAVLEALSVDERERTWREQLGAQSSQLLVAEENAVVVGWSSFGPSGDADAQSNTAEVYAVYLDPARWRRGIGQGLWHRVLEGLTALRFRRVTVWVLESNEAARRFYEAMGCLLDVNAAKVFERGGYALQEVRYSLLLHTPNANGVHRS